MSKKILCIGSMNKDVFFPYDNLSFIETPEDTLSKKKMVVEVGAKYRSQDRFESSGGCATNVAQGLSRLEVPVALISNVGRDELGEALLKEVKEEGVDTTFVSIKEDCRTDLSAIIVDEMSGERTVFYNRDANETFSFREEMFSGAKAVFVSGLYGDWKEAVASIRTLTERFSLPLYYNPSHSNVCDDPSLVWDMIRNSRGVFMNKDEAMEFLMKLKDIYASEQLFDIDEERLESEEYLAMFLAREGSCEFIVITDGSRGAWVYERSDDAVHHRQADHPEKIIDSTGAGDAFTSGFLGAKFSDKDTKTALTWGIQNATNVIKYYGGKSGLLKKEHIQE